MCNTLSDEDLIKYFLSENDDHYFTLLLERHARLVYGRCLSMLRSPQDADDAAQVVWTKVYFALPKFRADSQFKTWLFRIVNNHCLNIVRSRKELLIELDDNASYDLEPTESTADKIDIEINVTKMLDSVSKQEKAMLIMKYVDNYSYEDIARQFNISLSAAKMRIVRAKERIRKHAQDSR